MIVFPLFAALVSAACTVEIARDLFRRPRPDKAAWLIAFAIFTVAAASEVVGSSLGWTPFLARLYYLTGAVLVVGYLALGELYLLAGHRISKVAPGVALLVTAFAASVVWAAPIDQRMLASEGWQAIARPPGSILYLLAITLNAGGTFVLVGGLLWSAWRFRRLGAYRHRMISCLLIAVGALTVASGGALTRLGDPAYLYIAMAAGIAIIFAGYLQARRSDDRAIAPGVPAMREAIADDGQAVARHGLVPLPPRRWEDTARHDPLDAGIAFLETRFLPLGALELAELGRVWSVEPPATDRMTRHQARRVWALRSRLSPEGQRLLDGHSAPSMLQLAELYFEVFAPATTEPARDYSEQKQTDRAEAGRR